MAVTADEIMDELHIDSSDVEQRTINNLITDAQELVTNSVSSTLTNSDMESNFNPTYDRCVKTLVCQLYYDRSLDAGLSRGYQMMRSHLESLVLVFEKKRDDNAKV
ncbi:head-tail connector protein [Pediococcus argentinicus]|uniref:head-tail connector protein n=1 Tax=Pediococcus argentinicus TaxID=480391 RepID=UPI00338E5BC9